MKETTLYQNLLQKEESVERSKEAQVRERKEWEQKEEEAKQEILKRKDEKMERSQSIQQKKQEVQKKYDILSYLKENEAIEEEVKRVEKQKLYQEIETLEREIIGLEDEQKHKEREEVKAVQEWEDVKREIANFKPYTNKYTEIRKELEDDRYKEKYFIDVSRTLDMLTKELDITVQYKDVHMESGRIGFREVTFINEVTQEEILWELDRFEAEMGLVSMYDNELAYYDKMCLEHDVEEIYDFFGNFPRPFIHFATNNEPKNPEEHHLIGFYLYVESLGEYVFVHTGEDQVENHLTDNKTERTLYIEMRKYPISHSLY